MVWVWVPILSPSWHWTSYCKSLGINCLQVWVLQEPASLHRSSYSRLPHISPYITRLPWLRRWALAARICDSEVCSDFTEATAADIVEEELHLLTTGFWCLSWAWHSPLFTSSADLLDQTTRAAAPAQSVLCTFHWAWSGTHPSQRQTLSWLVCKLHKV